ncbi:efflux RND transporter permease subunit [Proteinivorax hydrogeniformans]|uniref:Efflux RND transporter permease subunit n=1 Tax=Proteinivorax hydrogeniformans TaxID=1826727 RepID=A0AAU8HUQ5_9FIRM
MLPLFSVKKPHTIVVAVIIIAILGWVSFANMTTELMPNINLPFTVITTSYAGASPEEVESVLTRPMEQSMATLSNISEVSSVSQENLSLIILEFEETANMDSAMIEIRENLDMISASMPDEVGSSTIMRLNPDMMPVMSIAASVEGQTTAEASQMITDNVILDLESVEGVASVTASGLGEHQIEVILRQDKIDEVNQEIQQEIMSQMAAPNQEDLQPSPKEQLGDFGGNSLEIDITKDMVSGILSGQNFSMPAGYIIEEGVDYLVRTGDDIEDIEELKNLKIVPSPMEGISSIVLEDVAEINVINSSDDSYAKVNGEDAIIIDIQKQTDYSTAGVAQDVRERMDEIMDTYEEVSMTSLMDQGEYVDMVISSITNNLIAGAVLAIFILLLFLRDFKPTIAVGFAIPVSLVAAFVMMYFSNVSLNIISMGGLALGVGMLVDNSIVVIENIYRMRNEGKNAKDAAIEGARQVAGAITASTLTTVSVFVPILFTHGLTREIFGDMGLTIAYSLVASLLISLTLVPMIASNVMTSNKQKEHKILDAIKVRYTKVLTFSLRRKWLVLIVAVALFIGSIYGAFGLGTEFMPATDTGQLSVSMELEEDTTFEEATEKSDEIMDLIYNIEGVETVGAFLGGGMMGMGGSSESISMYVLLDESERRPTNEVAQEIRNVTSHFESEITVNDDNMDMAATTGAGVSLSIVGRDLDVLEQTAKEVAEIIDGVEGTINVSDGLDRTSPEYSIVVDKDKSIAHGLTVAQVFAEVNSLLSDSGAATTLSIGLDDYDIFVMDDESKEGVGYEDLEQLTIESPQGKEVLITDISSIEETTGFSSINRSGQQRYVTVSAEVEEGYNIGLVSNEIEDALADYEQPEGYRIDIGGEMEMIMDAFADLFLMLALGITFIYLIMVAQFQSLLSPFIVMFTIPLAFTGGFLALIITRNPVSIIGFVGLIILAGVVVNNGIVFVDYINKLRESGMAKKEAIILAGNTRLRPIVMTAITTIIALSTMSLGVGMGMEMIQPMAITAVGGLIYSTVLTLIIIPVLYDAFNRKDTLG